MREAGPYAFRGDLHIDGAPIGFRATLCRCGASKNKPYCDGSHHDAGLVASGEPPTRETDTLASRDGRLAIDPQTDAPLAVRGNLEITSGTGRVVARIASARLCRCGASGTKPSATGAARAPPSGRPDREEQPAMQGNVTEISVNDFASRAPRAACAADGEVVPTGRHRLRFWPRLRYRTPGTPGCASTRPNAPCFAPICSFSPVTPRRSSNPASLIVRAIQGGLAAPLAKDDRGQAMRDLATVIGELLGKPARGP